MTPRNVTSTLLLYDLSSPIIRHAMKNKIILWEVLEWYILMKIGWFIIVMNLTIMFPWIDIDEINLVDIEVCNKIYI